MAHEKFKNLKWKQRKMSTLMITRPIKIDQCVFEEILDLRARGIDTRESCCGHGEDNMPHIVVDVDHIETMTSMGYEQQYLILEVTGEKSFWSCFTPKSECVCDGEPSDHEAMEVDDPFPDVYSLHDPMALGLD